jgi:hypothetical protein
MAKSREKAQMERDPAGELAEKARAAGEVARDLGGKVREIGTHAKPKTVAAAAAVGAAALAGKRLLSTQKGDEGE